MAAVVLFLLFNNVLLELTLLFKVASPTHPHLLRAHIVIAAVFHEFSWHFRVRVAQFTHRSGSIVSSFHTDSLTIVKNF